MVLRCCVNVGHFLRRNRNALSLNGALKLHRRTRRESEGTVAQRRGCRAMSLRGTRFIPCINFNSQTVLTVSFLWRTILDHSKLLYTVRFVSTGCGEQRQDSGGSFSDLFSEMESRCRTPHVSPSAPPPSQVDSILACVRRRPAVRLLVVIIF